MLIFFFFFCLKYPNPTRVVPMCCPSDSDGAQRRISSHLGDPLIFLLASP